jgi:hypothetical protein
LAHGFFDVFGALEFTVVEHADFKAKAVGPEVDGGKAVFSGH